MNAITVVHIAAGLVALGAGAAAVAVRKGGAVHVSAGAWFSAAMLVLGVTAAVLGPMASPPRSPIGGIMTCYFVATAWMAARRRSGVVGTPEKIACAAMLLIAALIIAGGVKAAAGPPQPDVAPGPGVVLALGGLCLLAALLDLNVILRGPLSRPQRISRHLWRMCFAFFIATGSFFLGQQDVLPKAVRGSPVLFVLALAPLVLMLFWLVRVRIPKRPDVTPYLRARVAAILGR